MSAGEKPNGLIAKGHSGTGYKGMCPPDGKHTYRIAVYAQKDDVNAKKSGKYTLEKFEKKFGDSIIEKIIITGDFK